MLATTHPRFLAAVAALLLLAGCPNDDDGAGGSAAGSGGRSGSHAGGAGGSSGAGASAAGSHDCGGIAIPALCKLCSDNTCGKPSCDGGKFIGFVCPNESDAGTLMDAGNADAGGVCNLACVQGKHCVANPTPTCVDDSADAGNLQWVQSCGQPVCRADNTFYDDPNIPNCTDEKLGQACAQDGARCDGVLSCGATYLCAAHAPVNCPISRARFKQEISYLDDAERARFHELITQLKLATYRYQSAPDVPQLGFMIDDVEPSVAVAGDHVNLYGYMSMAVAAIQVQDQRIRTLERLVAELQAPARAKRGHGASASSAR